MATIKVIFLLPNTVDSIDRWRRFNCGWYFDFITVAERNQLMAGNGITIQGLKDKYPEHLEEIVGQGEANPIFWANAATPTVKDYIVDNLDVTNVEWGRVQGWLASQTDKWIRCNWEGPTGDVLAYDSCGNGITNMPPEGTDTVPLGNGPYLMGLSGFVSWFPPE